MHRLRQSNIRNGTSSEIIQKAVFCTGNEKSLGPHDQVSKRNVQQGTLISF